MQVVSDTAVHTAADHSTKQQPQPTQDASGDAAQHVESVKRKKPKGPKTPEETEQDLRRRNMPATREEGDQGTAPQASISCMRALL